MNWKHAILPVVVLVIYVFTSYTMVQFERTAAYSLTEISNLQLELAKYPKGGEPERQLLMQGFEERIGRIQKVPFGDFALGVVRTADTLTFGKEFCHLSGQPCAVYTAELVQAGRYHADVQKQMNQYKVVSFENAVQYSTTNHVLRSITLMIEALALSLLIGYAWSKRKIIRKFYSFTKFKIITTIILFAVIVGPILINDDWYYSAPLIWYILAPPLMLELIWEGFAIIGLALSLLWFYTIATLIERWKKSK
jgi:hypothetical protein